MYDAFLDWAEQVNQYFEWKETPEDKKIEFFSLKLKGNDLVCVVGAHEGEDTQ